MSVSDGNLVDSATDDDQASKDLAKSKDVVNLDVKFDADEVYISD